MSKAGPDRRWYGVHLLTAALSAAGCDRPSSSGTASPSTAEPALPAPAPPAPGSADVEGHVKLRGIPANLPALDVSSIRECAIHHPNGMPDESIVVGEAGGLQNVIVSLEGVARASGSFRPPVILDQLHCQYVPHVLSMQSGQTLRVQSSDPFLHNVHGLAEHNRPFNLSEPGPGSKDVTGLVRPEIFEVKCDVHPWMRAWVAVFDHPYFTVTHSDGSFRLADVPPGKYTLAAWQERLGKQTRDIEVRSGHPAFIDLEYGR